ncbi:glycosyltransferase [Candidatus Microgenomates bacterium]|nr:glycosyltransferase [Candidatus Microgenomates bacterium]
MRVALIHGFLKEYGGAERVLEALHEIYPQAPIYTAFVDFEKLGPHAERIRKWDIRESWVGKSWLVKKLHSPLRFLAPLIWESFNLDEYDLVISSSGWYICRGVITRPKTLHICYLHHPPRHLYGYQTSFDWQKHLPIRIYGNIVNHFLRQYDFKASQKVDYFIANSQETQKRITKFYRRESAVIYPPVDSWRGRTSRRSDLKKKDYFLSVSRLARAKNIDLAIKACNKLKLPFKIVGKGREEEYLKSIAGPTIEFIGEAPDEELNGLYAGAKALIFPAQDEEFGIVPVEAMAYGVPVIAYRSGGLKETVVDGVTGIFFDQLSVDALIKAIEQFNHLAIDSKDCTNQAHKFSKEQFEREIKDFINQKLKSR